MEDPKEHTNWKRMRFKRNKVWVAVDEQDHPVIDSGKVLIKYQLDQKHQYWVHAKSVFPLDETATTSTIEPCTAPAPPSAAVDSQAPIDPEMLKKTICIYTDGACSGNPGPAGIGVVMRYQRHQKEISRYIGTATNNIAELEAIKVGLESVKNKNLPVLVFTDSSYALGVLAKGWKATENLKLIQQIKSLTGKFRNLRIVKVKGHAGHAENERADRLAVRAIQKAGSEYRL